MNLRFSQVRSTVKSVARWTWERYTGSGRCHRGVMGLNPRLSLHERQCLSARRTHRLRQERTETKIKAACRFLHDQGKHPFTQKAIAEVARLTRQTIANYAPLLKAFFSSLVLSSPLSTTKVNYGVYQITARGCSGWIRSWGAPFLKHFKVIDEIEGIDTS